MTLPEDVQSEALSWIGKEIRMTQYNTEASRDNIRHFALGTGDMNPLWVDYSYGRRSRYGTNIAPPLFLVSICDAVITPGLPDMAGLRIRTDWTFYAPTRLGDQLQATGVVDDVKITQGKRGDDRIIQTGLTRYFRVDACASRALVAEVRSTDLRISPRAEGSGTLKIPVRSEHQYTAEELRAIRDDVLAVQPRGGEPRYWEDVEVGDAIGTVVKGPYTSMSMHCYYAGAAGSAYYVAHDVWWRYRWLAEHEPDALPTNGLSPEYFMGTGMTSLGHHDRSVAESIGMPGAYDNGNQRTAMVQHLLTNWCGDDGMLRNLAVDISRPVILGDTLWITGKVTGKKMEGAGNNSEVMSRALVQGTVEVRNQLSDLVSTGDWTVQLPTRFGNV